MGASHPLAGERVKHGAGEKRDADGDEHEIQHEASFRKASFMRFGIGIRAGMARWKI
jgi:hypothetical protein